MKSFRGRWLEVLGGDAVELAEMIRALRGELNAALVDGTEDPVLFEIGPVEVEATVTAERTAGGRGAIRFWVVEAGADEGRVSSKSQRITLTLQPKIKAHDGTLETAYIVGDAVNEER